MRLVSSPLISHQTSNDAIFRDSGRTGGPRGGNGCTHGVDGSAEACRGATRSQAEPRGALLGNGAQGRHGPDRVLTAFGNTANAVALIGKTSGPPQPSNEGSQGREVSNNNTALCKQTVHVHGNKWERQKAKKAKGRCSDKPPCLQQ